MKSKFTTRAAMRSALFSAACLFAAEANAQTLFVLTTDGKFATTTVTNPGLLSTPITITGVTANDTLVAIDVRPQNQNLYALGVNTVANTVQLYLLSTVTGTAAPVGSAASFVNAGGGAVGLPATGWDIDFNPAADRLRVVNTSGQNFRMNPNTGAAVDGDLGGAAGSVAGVNMDGPINGATNTVGGAAYTNNRPNNGNITTLYTLAVDALYIQNPPNAGTETLVSGVVGAGSVSGFDIAPGVNVASSNSAATSGVGVAVLKRAASSSLYTVDLATGVFTARGSLDVRSFAISTEVGAAFALDATGPSLSRFDPATPGTTTTVSITGLNAGETLVGIDGRPQTGQTYGLGVNATANTATLYLIDPSSGALTVVGAAGSIAFVDAGGNAIDLPDPATTGYGIDFNPTVDRLRVVTGSGLNFRVNPNTGAPVDGNLNNTVTPPAGTNPDAPLNGGSTSGQGTAYTNSYAQSLTGGVTTQYVFSSASDTLFIQNPPNAGTLTNGIPVTLGGSPLDLSGVNGFDIPSTVSVTSSGSAAAGQGWVLARVGGVTGLYRLDLATGAATSIGALGAGTSQSGGLVVWATEPNAADISVESPVGTTILDGGGTVGFGATLVGGSSTRSILVKNVGGKTLAYTTTVDGSGFTVTQNPAANLSTATSTTLNITFTAAAAGSVNGTLHIISNDPDEASFEIALTGTGIVALTDDIAFRSDGATRFNPLANDELPGDFTITGVSDPSITISGRTLTIPATFFGSFTYTVSNGTVSGSATVTVNAGASVVNPTRFNGLVTDVSGAIFGMANVGVSASGIATAQIRVRSLSASVQARLPVGTPVALNTAVGRLTLVRNAHDVGLTLITNGRTLTGTLRAVVTSATAATHNIALASVDTDVPGGGYAIARRTTTGAVRIVGLLPDGLPFSAASYLRDNNTVALYTQENDGTDPNGFLGGELTLANLTKTDLTGEITWTKPRQRGGAIGNHLRGVDTILTANGSLHTGTIPISGAGTLTLSGGNLAATQTTPVTVSAGVPTAPSGSLRTWTTVSPASGRFAAKVIVPGISPAVEGSGIYLPKSNSAWGFFPGKVVGGRIKLTVP